MQFYKSPNEYPAYGCDNPFYWITTAAVYDQNEDETSITIDFGYEGEVSTETRVVPGDYSDDPVNGVINHLPEYVNSTGPIHGGGFPIRK